MGVHSDSIVLDINCPSDTKMPPGGDAGKEFNSVLPFGVCAGCSRMKDLFFRSWRTNLLYCSESCCVKKECPE